MFWRLQVLGSHHCMIHLLTVTAHCSKHVKSAATEGDDRGRRQFTRSLQTDDGSLSKALQVGVNSLYTHTHTHTHVYTYIYVYTYMSYIYVSIYTYVYLLCMHSIASECASDWVCVPFELPADEADNLFRNAIVCMILRERVCV